MTAPDLYYGRPLTEAEQGIADDLRRLNPGQRVGYRGDVNVTRALWGPWFYVQRGTDGARSECDRLSAAVHARNLITIGGTT